MKQFKNIIITAILVIGGTIILTNKVIIDNTVQENLEIENKRLKDSIKTLRQERSALIESNIKYKEKYDSLDSLKPRIIYKRDEIKNSYRSATDSQLDSVFRARLGL